MATKWRLRDGVWRIYYSEPNNQNIRVTLSKLISLILENDYHPDNNPNGLTPAQQMAWIRELPGLTAAEMEAVLNADHKTGMPLDDSIRAVISKHRATDRTDKNKNRIR